jgi:hypothetical protein
VVESTALEKRHIRKGIESSNLSLSAKSNARKGVLILRERAMYLSILRGDSKAAAMLRRSREAGSRVLSEEGTA